MVDRRRAGRVLDHFSLAAARDSHGALTSFEKKMEKHLMPQQRPFPVDLARYTSSVTKDRIKCLRSRTPNCWPATKTLWLTGVMTGISNSPNLPKSGFTFTF